jgi:hypothetical protein
MAESFLATVSSVADVAVNAADFHASPLWPYHNSTTQSIVASSETSRATTNRICD